MYTGGMGPGGPKKSLAAIVFGKNDKDGSGAIDSGELSALCYEMGYHLDAEQVKAALLLIDKDSNGVITLDEFEKWWKEGGEKRWRVQLDDAGVKALNMAVTHFQYFDKDQGGTISTEEFRDLYSNLCENGIIKKEDPRTRSASASFRGFDASLGKGGCFHSFRWLSI
ncbi:hypothetical protein CYMTET_15479 [Cymbomonas tetramitiformis]|uniref:EF-hand domain-containing protein n=1 Tax=Cymbomonas tetramitiformis TaxID=36881 RepID=A0AAE0GEH6_9CHLO|nr:hypothetical protein CYMTET_15479 [Cymbomonas tetramitiformis]